MIESHKLISEAMSLINAPLENNFRMRMLLLIYSHITEMNDFYSIIANLLWIIKGEEYSIEPFNCNLFEDKMKSDSPHRKVQRIKSLSVEAGFPKIGEVYEYMFIKQIRNAFFHSDYVLYNNEFRIIKGEGLNTGEDNPKSISFDWLIRRMEVAINLMLQILHLIDIYKLSYTIDKKVKGKVVNCGVVDIVLLGGDKGLYGIRC